MNIWTYVITHNRGSAPNYEGRFTTLAICKPLIRKNANEGDVVLAFTGTSLNKHNPHAVCWAGVVSEVKTFAEYWHDARFTHKRPSHSKSPDNFYKPTERGTLVWVENEIHGSEQIERDTGGHHVLIFQERWYFGENGPALPFRFGLRMLPSSRRGHKKYQDCEAVWPGLQKWLNEHSQVAPPIGIASCGNCLPPKPEHFKISQKKCHSIC